MKSLLKREDFLLKIIQELKIPTVAQIQALNTLLNKNLKKLKPEDTELIELTLTSCIDVHNFLDIFSLIQKCANKEIKLNYEKFNISDLVFEILFQKQVLLKYHKLNIEFQAKSCIIYADKIFLKKVIENLLNYIISTSFQNSKNIIKIKEIKNNVVFEIQNDYKIDDINLLIPLFSNLMEFSKEKMNIKLGLFLSKELIHLHFGKMIIQNLLEGSIIGFEIPSK